MRDTARVTTATTVAEALVEAIIARDVARAVALLHPEIDFRAMTPNRIWEADGPAGVEDVLRQWFEDPDEELHGIAATPTEWTAPPASRTFCGSGSRTPTEELYGIVATPTEWIEGTARVGWLVRISDADGPHVFEQQAYVRERDSQIGWMRVICSGWIPLADPAA